MKRKLTLMVITCLMYVVATNAQCNYNLPSPPGNSCEAAAFFCNNEIDGFCSTLGGPNGSVPNPLCEGGTGVPNNISWIAFAAGSTSISIQVDPSNCQSQTGQAGVQAGIYGTCPGGGGSPSDAIVCEANCLTSAFTLTANDFVIGQVYYLFIDGCAGDVCDYTLAVTDGSTMSPSPGPVGPITGSVNACVGQSGVLFSVFEIPNASNYTWTVPGDASYVDNNALGSEILVDFGVISGQVCVEASNDCFPTPVNQQCITINLLPPPQGTVIASYCTGSAFNYNGTDYFAPGTQVTLPGASFQGCDSIVNLQLTQFSLPPVDVYVGYCQSDGFYNYPGDGNDYTAGDYTIVFSQGSFQGCDSTVVLHVDQWLASENYVDIAICDMESYTICGIPYQTNGSHTVGCGPNFRGCDSTIFLNLIVLNPIATIATPATIGCGANSSIFLEGISPGATEYLWSTTDGDICGGFDGPITEACLAGTYCLEVTGSITTPDQGLVSCTDMTCVTVTSNSEQPATTVATNNIACNGQVNGSATITVSNTAIGPFDYTWSPNVSSTNSANNLPGGTYSVTVSAQGNGCTIVETIVISEPEVIAIGLTQVDILCNGGSTASATATPTGGTAPFTYSWCNGQAMATATGLGVGPCVVVVTDASGCTNSASVTIIEASAIVIDMNETNVSCNGGNNGSCVANPFGGTPPYTYLWCDGQATATAMNLPAGTCAVTVTDSNGCTMVQSGTLTEPDAITTTSSQTDVLCNGDMNGTATITPAGGTGPFTYSWCNGQVTATATGLGVGPCAVVVTDANGCTTSTGVTLTAPNAMTLSTTQTNVLCEGETDGTGTAIPVGGTAPYSYLWCNNQTAPTATGLPAGICSVVVTDANGCTQMDQVDLTTPTALSVAVGQTDILCNGGNDGTGTATPSGGTGPYSYQWCNGETTATATGLALGNCQVIVTDANGCTMANSVDIGETSSISVAVTFTDVLCNGESDGTATATPGGGAGGFTYSWCNGQITPTATGLPAGACLVVITDMNGCTSSESVTLSEPNALTVSANATDLSCNGADDGTATATPSGGAGNFTYLWCNNQTSDTATDLPSGPCEVVVTDANGCTTSITVNPTEPAAVALSVTSEDITCFGESNGTATVTPSGGTGTFSYNWCNGQGTPTAVGLNVGPCEVIVTDGNGCTAAISVDLSQPSSALDITGSSLNATCGQDDGSISITVNGGTTPYIYDWNDPAPDVQNPTGLGPGNYTVIVTDGNDCTASFTVGVMTPTGLDAAATWTDVSCNGGDDGTVSVTVQGGTGPYDYDWDSPLISTDSPTGSDLPADGYNVTVTDADGCTFVTSAAIEEPEEIVITGNATQETCGESNGTISIVVQGGTEPYDYSWNNGDTDADIVDLSAGNYVLDLVDANGCTANFDIGVSTPNQLEVDFTSVNVSCEGGNDGSIELIVTGGQGPFEYDWDNTGDVPDPSDLSADTYNVIVTDDTGCSVTTQVEITEPTPIVAVNLVQQATCGDDNGGVSLTVTGGTEPYDYLWSNGDTSDNPTGLPEGTIIVTVTDDNGCTVIETIDVDSPAEITLNVSATMTSCFEGTDGSIDLTVNGGTAPFSYMWTGGSIEQDPTALTAGTYQVEVTDANNCIETTSIMVGEPSIIAVTGSTTNATCGDTNGTASISATGGTPPYSYTWTGTVSTEPNPTNLGPGTYCVDVTDDNGCVTTECFDVATPDGLALTPTTTDVICFGELTGVASIAVAGGVGPFSYLWETGDETSEITALAAGTYEVTVTDDDTGCDIITTAIINQPDAIVISGNELQATCGESNGSVSLTVVGGTGGYAYAWSPSGSIEQNPTGLDADNHTVIVTDDAGCSETFSIDVTSAPELTSSAVSTDVSCFGGNDGTVDITVVGGTAPYNYVWSNGSTDPDPTNFMAGDVTGTVTDLNGCITEVSLVIGEPEALALASTTTDETCGESNGTISLTVTGGTAPYNYNWTPALPDTPNPTDLVLGTYCVDVVDANGCILTDCIDVSTPNALVVDAVVTNANCNGSSDGSIELSISGGVGPYTQLWSTGWTDPDLLGIPVGSYSVDVTDASGCVVTVTEIITEPTLIEITDVSTPAVCGQENGATDITVTGGSGTYTYLWSNGFVTEDPDNFPSGNYNVTATDVNGCTGTHEISVVPPNGPAISIMPSDASCFGFADGAADLTVTGGVAPFTYQWPGGIVTEDITDLPAGNYTVTVTDNDDCTYTASTLIAEPDVIVVTGSATDETCNLSNGSIVTSVSGGTEPYDYLWSPSGDIVANPTGLASMDHTVVVTDANGCTGTMIIGVDAPNQLGGTLTPSNISCDGGADGSLIAIITGGNAPYTYNWTPAVGVDDLATDLPVGDYSLEVIDADGCIFTVSQTLTAPTAIQVSSMATEATCGETNGSITLTTSGGVGPYTYDWSPALSDQPDQVDLGAGTYTCEISDANGCTTEIDVDVNTPDMLAVDANGNDALCFEEASGSADAMASGGTGPFSYEWFPGGLIGPNQTGLAAGNYAVIVTDDVTGCSVSATITIGQPEAIMITETTTDALCGGVGTATLTITGGTAPYSYLWSTGSTEQNPLDLPAGNHNVTVTDINNCTGTQSAFVDSPNQPTTLATPIDASCNGDSNGGINVTISGGTGGFTFMWSNGSTMQNLSSVPAGDYSLVITDTDGCEYTISETVGQPFELTADVLGQTDVSCSGDNNGDASLNVAGGTMPYTYLWSPSGETTADPQLLVGGVNTVVVTDANGCTVTESVSLNEPDVLLLSSETTATLCGGGDDGSIDLTVGGGTEPYIYAWSNGDTDQDPTGLSAGTFVVVVTDANGCSDTWTETVSSPAEVDVSVMNVSEYGIYNLSCESSEDGSAEAVATGGAGPYTFEWDNGSTDAMISNIAAGTYSVIVTDVNGCTGASQVTLEAPAGTTVEFAIEDASCFGDNDGAVFVTDAFGGTPPYRYSIDGGDYVSGGLFGSLTGGQYEISVIDANGCTNTESVFVMEPAEVVVELPDDFSIQLGRLDSLDIEAIVNVGIDSSSLQYWEWTEGRFFLENDTTRFDAVRWVNPLETTLYEFFVIDTSGCVGVDQLLITVNKDRKVYIPNAFSPNGDGINDDFFIEAGPEVEIIKEFKIFNRWGEVVFELSNFFAGNPDDGWNGMFKGQMMNQAVFVYYVEVEFKDGRIEILQGDVTLLK